MSLSPVFIENGPHVFACFAHAQLCIGKFASKLLRRLSTQIAKVKSCINFHSCITVIMLYFFENWMNTEIGILLTLPNM